MKNKSNKSNLYIGCFRYCKNDEPFHLYLLLLEANSKKEAANRFINQASKKVDFDGSIVKKYTAIYKALDIASIQAPAGYQKLMKSILTMCRYKAMIDQDFELYISFHIEGLDMEKIFA